MESPTESTDILPTDGATTGPVPPDSPWLDNNVSITGITGELSSFGCVISTITQTEVFCTLTFEAIHRWANCPIEEVSYLRDPHRHIFHIRAYKPVNHDDRDVEFIWLKHQIEQHLRKRYPVSDQYKCADLGSTSCEMIARELIDQFNLSKCEVSEDGENGAIMTVMQRSYP